MQDDDEFDGGDRPLTGAAKREYQTILRHAEVCTLKDRAKEIELACMRSVPVPSLDVEMSQLSTDPAEREKQMELLWKTERKLRLRCQDSLRTALDLIVR